MALFETVEFHVIQNEGMQSGWTSTPRYADFPIPGSSRVVTQQGGFDLEQLECGGLFLSYSDYETMRAYEGTTAYLVDFPLPGTPTFGNVLLRTVGPPSAYVLKEVPCVRASLLFTRRRPD